MIRKLLRVATLAFAASAFWCDAKSPSFFLPGATSPQTGNLTGLVANGATPINGATVALSGTPARSMTTGSNGIYNFLELNLGSYTVTTTAPGFMCPSPTVNIQLDMTTTANIACVRLAGSVGGTILLAGSPTAGIVVTLTQGGITIGTATTAANGTYTISNVPPGDYTATVTPPPNTNCFPPSRSVTVQSLQTATANFDCQPQSGVISGTVTLNGSPVAGATITISQGGTTVSTQTSNANGVYAYGADVGSYTVSATLAGATCTPGPQIVTVTNNVTSRVNFACTSPGSLTGTVRTDGVRESGVSVSLTQGSTAIATTSTDLFGNYSFTGLASGNYTVTITPKSGQTCSVSSADVSIEPGQQTSVDFDCVTAPTTFTVNLTPSYRHIAVGSSETCVKITTTPPRPGATWSVTWTGPATVGSVTRTGTLDANGEAFDRQPINDFGTYTATVSVTSSGVTMNASANVTVSSAAGTCPAP